MILQRARDSVFSHMGTLISVKNQVFVVVWANFCALHSIILISVSISTPGAHCSYYSGSVVELAVGDGATSGSDLWLVIALLVLGLLFSYKLSA